MVSKRSAESFPTIAEIEDEQGRVEWSKHYSLSSDKVLLCRDRALDDKAAANLAF